jgi:hypothetical protein
VWLAPFLDEPDVWNQPVTVAPGQGVDGERVHESRGQNIQLGVKGFGIGARGEACCHLLRHLTIQPVMQFKQKGFFANKFSVGIADRDISLSTQMTDFRLALTIRGELVQSDLEQPPAAPGWCCSSPDVDGVVESVAATVVTGEAAPVLQMRDGVFDTDSLTST